jgi:uncharacterized zinc-type alcohol dehydrogenase-like protein
MSKAVGYAARNAETPLAPFHFDRRELRPDDVKIVIRYCGVCHTDLHFSRDDWKRTVYPVVPGHEIVGEVIATGAAATKFKPGDRVAVGCMVDSCLACEQCDDGQEQSCLHGNTATYNSADRQTGAPTFGGYSDHVVVREQFVVRVPDALDMARAAPLLCAGITTYSPLRHWAVGPGDKVAVVGLGGLGHMGVKLAVGLGADVTVISTSPSKEKDALALGAHRVLISTDKAAMAAARASFDFVLDTIPVKHEVASYLMLLRAGGAMVMVGAVDMIPPFHTGLLMGGRKSLSGSAIGGIAETQELLDFCAENNILPECEMIAIQDINGAFERMERSDVKYRFVIDMASLAKDAA